MTRRSSQRALAREIYREMVEKRAGDPSSLRFDGQAPTANPPSPGGFGGQGLTAKVRALYEHSAVPIAEIARLAGVTERTVYKYARKRRWKRRYRWRATSPARRGRRLQPRADVAPVKGAGGRFIRRADQGRRIAKGLKATDAAAARCAVAACGKAGALARATEAIAVYEEACEAVIRAMEATNRMLDDSIKHVEEYNKAHPRTPVPQDTPVAQALNSSLHFCASWCEAASKQKAAALEGYLQARRVMRKAGVVDW